MARLDLARPADAIVVLSAAQYAGKPSPVFQSRLDHADELFKRGLAPLVITTGGTSPGDTMAEAKAGKKYLIQHGVPSGKIIEEDTSSSTFENMSEVARIAPTKKITSIIIVSDRFHMYRALLLAQKFKLTAFPSPTSTSPITPGSWLERKYIAREILPSLYFLLQAPFFGS